MSLALCLLGYSLVVVVFAPDALQRATRSGSAPRMGIAIWMIAIGSVPAAWMLAAGLVVGELILAGGDVGRVLAGCVAALRAAAVGEHGTPVQVGLVVLAAAVAGGLLTLLARVGRALGRSRRHTHHHAEVARLVGEVDQALGAVIVDAPDPMVYAVAGRPATIVVSRATLDVLDGAQLRAVLAHERAHLAGRHHLLLAVAQALATAMPRIRLFTTGSTELGRLVEMCADDTAASGHGNRVVVGALLALVGGPAPPHAALAAASTGVADRVQRLMFPPGPDRLRTVRLGLALGMLGLLSGPAFTMALVLARSALCDTTLFSL